jgi:heme exporter protein C
MACGIVMAFLSLPAVAGFQEPEMARMLAFHLPNAITAIWAAVAGAVYAWRYLQKRDALDDARSATSAALATLFCVLTTVTGMVFAQVQWGAPWSWDPKQTGMFFLLLLYAAYFVLRGSLTDPEKRGSVCAVYMIFAAVMTPMLGYVIPKYLPSLHPINAKLDPMYHTVIWTLSACLIGLYSWIHNLSVRTARVQLFIEENEENKA